jgi:hypothetical protein
MPNEKLLNIKNKDFIRVGWISSIIVGILYILVGVTHFLLPLDQLRGGRGINEAFFLSLAEHSLIFSIHYWIVVVLSLFSISVILVFYKIISSAHRDIVLWVTVIALIGTALSIVDFASVGVKAPRIAQQFSSYTAIEKSVAIIIGIPHIDPCFLSWGLLGIWSSVCNWLALKTKLLPKTICYIGIIGSCLYMLVFLGSLFQKQLIVDIAVGVGGLIIAPIWYIWFGLTIKKIYVHTNCAG